MLSLAFAAMLAVQAPAAETPRPIVSPPPIIAPPSAECCLVRALTPVRIIIVDPIASDQNKPGDRFPIQLADPVILDNGATLPAGTGGIGEVVHAAKSRAMGKAGELILAARYLEYEGVRIPLRSLRYGQGRGKDNVGTAAVVGFAVSPLITPFITGGEVRLPGGTTALAKVATDTRVDVTKLSPPAAQAVSNIVEGTEE